MLTNKIFNASALTSPVVHAHISCYASAQQLLCDRRYYLSQQPILSFPETYTIFSNNISVMFQ